jgi:2-dehydropantoate 2-reductase
LLFIGGNLLHALILSLAVRFVVFGAGALGSLFGGILSEQHDVVLVGRREHMEAIERRGLRISGRTVMVVKPRTATVIPPGEIPDCVFITTKAYDTEAAVEALKPLHPSSLFVSLQNGLGNAEILSHRVARSAAGVTDHGVTFVGPGHVHHAGEGPTILGGIKGVRRAEVDDVARALSDCGIASTTTERIDREIWAKVVVNSAINPLTALVGQSNGVLLERPFLAALALSVVKEGVSVAKAAGMDLDEAHMLRRFTAVVEGTAGNRSSMLQDVERGRRTEVDAINGALAGEAHRLGLEAPLNRSLHTLVLVATGAAAAGPGVPRGGRGGRPF